MTWWPQIVLFTTPVRSLIRSIFYFILGKKQTMIRVPLYAMGRDPALFDDPLEYKPDRWLRDDTSKSHYHAFASQPFGFGTRMCLGKKEELSTGIS